jgi:hypothetical protein
MNNTITRTNVVIILQFTQLTFNSIYNLFELIHKLFLLKSIHFLYLKNIKKYKNRFHVLFFNIVA